MTNNSQQDEKRLRSVAQSEYELTRMKYDSEQRREDSLIRQSGQMQAAFSFTAAAFFMALPVLIPYRGRLSLEFFLAAGWCITLALLVSLICATIAQSRRKQATLEDGETLIAAVEDNELLFQTEVQRMKFLARRCAEFASSLAENNEFRVRWIQRSMLCFYLAVGLCVFWGAMGTILLFWGG